MTYQIDDLRTLMTRLRDATTGCPWDIKQTYASIVPHTLEEVYEVVEAIENHDYDNLEEELGDLLFQVVFYAQIASEENRFDLSGVIHRVTEKLLRRHPHVFPDGTLNSQRQPDDNPDELMVNANWDAIKASEKPKPDSICDQVPRALPSLQRAYKLQKKAAKQGFDWPDTDGALAKLKEEIDELAQETTPERLLDEGGDVLFSLVNLLRKQGIDPDMAMRHANQKFERRFRHIESQAEKPLTHYTLDELDHWWNDAKEKERGQ
ncbi:nucleoside triphosphate pyrophosphohydrolase [Salinibius halmophilus]|uniref:nucleoside triphosphate pyrophosphohydrolase n=1 Tax=Salinibius halmophilus TaxID=1853216 RepID=UPI000E66C400|nr:nucleoside triphosphate pyrophosphohydrolase [Salinibius halmophilus]